MTPREHTLRLAYTPPFDWEGVHAYLALRAIPGVEVAGADFYVRTVTQNGRAGTVRIARTDPDALAVTVRLPEGIPDVAERVSRVFDLGADPATIAAALSADPFMAGLVAQRPGLRVPGAWDGFELAVRAVLGQQVSVAAATRLAARLVAAFGTPLSEQCEARKKGLTHLFPSPDALVEADVALALNMPRARGAAIRAIAAACIAEPDLFAVGQGLAAATARLKALRGIGDWTAQYVAMRALREPDALPTGDVGLLRALEDATGRPNAAGLDARSAAWRPWRAYAVQHLWAHDAARLAARPPKVPGRRRAASAIAEQGAGCAPGGTKA